MTDVDAPDPDAPYRCLYYSKAKKPLSDAELTELEEWCIDKNTEYNVTGYLVYYDESFIQYIEGRYFDIHNLMKNIEQDKRHEIKVRLEERMDTGRLFPGWRMRIFTRLRDSDMEGVLFVHLATMEKFKQGHDPEKVAWNLVDIMSQVFRFSSADRQPPALK